MTETSTLTQKLLKDYKQLQKNTFVSTTNNFIEVDEITLRISTFYEKIRGIIDWKGEHLLKRNVIERILRRKILSKTAINSKISIIEAEPFVIDILRSGNFESNRIKKEKITEIQKILDKYIYLINHFSQKNNGHSVIFGNWLSSIAACEIEEALSDSKKERLILSYAFNSLRKTIKTEEKINKKEEDLLLYVAIQQALFSLDRPIIIYHLLKFKYTNWNNLSKRELTEISKNICEEKIYIEKLLSHPLLKKFYQFCKVYNTPYLIIGDILKENLKKPEEIISNPEKTKDAIVRHYNKRVEKMKGRLYRGTLYSTISIFITNIAVLLAVEIPLSKHITVGEFTSFVIAIDILVPTLLMAFLAITASPPPKKNQKKVVLETMKVLYKKEIEETHIIKKPRERKHLLYFFVSVFYIISFLLSVGIIAWLLSLINFPLLSYFIFIIFLSLIAFAGVKIRESSKELYMIESKDNFFTIIIDIFALPVIQLGKWLTMRWGKYNILSVVFSAFLDMPFKIFLEFLDQWRNYLKEKKEEIY